MIPAVEYIQHMERVLKMIEDEAGEGLDLRQDSEILSTSEKVGPLNILTLNF